MDSSQRRAVIRVAIVDDDTWAGSNLATFLAQLRDMSVLDTCVSVDALLSGPGADADVVILDVQLRFDPVVVENIRRIVQRGPQVLLVSSYFEENEVGGALAAGAAGFTPKRASFDGLAAAIRNVAAGQVVMSREVMLAALKDRRPSAPRFTPREIDVLALSATGLSAGAVGRRLGVTENTVKDYLKSIRAKYRDAGRKVDSIVDLRTAAIQDGIVTTGRTQLSVPKQAEADDQN